MASIPAGPEEFHCRGCGAGRPWAVHGRSVVQVKRSRRLENRDASLR